MLCYSFCHPSCMSLYIFFCTLYLFSFICPYMYHFFSFFSPNLPSFLLFLLVSSLICVVHSFLLYTSFPYSALSSFYPSCIVLFFLDFLFFPSFPMVHPSSCPFFLLFLFPSFLPSFLLFSYILPF